MLSLDSGQNEIEIVLALTSYFSATSCKVLIAHIMIKLRCIEPMKQCTIAGTLLFDWFQAE